MKKSSYLKIMLLFAIVIMLTACTEEIPPGYVGMLMTPEGIEQKVLNPGRTSVYGRDRLILIETRDFVVTEKLSVLCADDLNFKFDLKLRSSLKAKDSKKIMQVLDRQGSKIKWSHSRGKLEIKELYDTYVRPQALSIARTVVSKYETTQIRENRESITKSIITKLQAAAKDAPIEITMLVTSNFDYPDVITRAMESKRMREIALKEEKAKQAVELLKADNRLKIAQKLKIVRTAEAEAEAAYMMILGKSLNPMFLKLKQIEAYHTLYSRAEAGDKVIVTGQAVPMIVTGEKRK